VSQDLVSFYEAGYTQEDPARAAQLGRWRAQGAEIKAGHAVELCRRAGVSVESVVEVGCGDGALLGALSARKVASRYDGFELSEPAARLAASRAVPGAVRVEPFDGRRVPAEDGAYDLAVVSHVLEHVPEPAELLAEAARVAPLVLVEVPLEDNRSASRPAKRAQALEIGHIQAFSRADVHALAAGAGLRVLAELTDPLPRRHHAFFAGSARARAAATVKWAVRAALWRVAPRRAERLFTVHHAALLGRPDADSAKTRPRAG
jgi:SAM-dependent methyltransferase